METEDISDILANLFLENELSFIIKSFYTASCARYPILIWNHFNNNCSRTNNNNEAYNLRVDKRSQKHPNIWVFTELCQKEELHASVKYERIENGTIKVRSRNGNDLSRDLVISNAKNTYLQNDQQFDDLEKLLNTVKRLVKVKRYYSYITNKNKIILF